MTYNRRWKSKTNKILCIILFFITTIVVVVDDACLSLFESLQVFFKFYCFLTLMLTFTCYLRCFCWTYNTQWVAKNANCSRKTHKPTLWLVVDMRRCRTRGQRRRVIWRINASVPARFGRFEPVCITTAAAVQKSPTNASDWFKVPHWLIVTTRARVILQQARFYIHTIHANEVRILRLYGISLMHAPHT